MQILTEPEMSIPDAVLSMYDGDELLAFSRIPVNEVVFILLKLKLSHFSVESESLLHWKIYETCQKINRVGSHLRGKNPGWR